MELRTSHTETFVKVNARVDIGVAPLVAALSEIPSLETVESCEGSAGEKNAFVIFRFGGWRHCAEFLFDKLLPAMDDDLRPDVALTIDGYAVDNCLGRISLPPEAVAKMTALVMSVRKYGYSGDMSCTSQHSC